MKPIVNLPWYDSPLAADALDLFWNELRRQLLLLGYRDLPNGLDREENLVEQWQDPALLLSQCCGPDLFTEATRGVSCLGRPVFTDLDCAEGYYYSHIVTLGLPLNNPRIAINSPTSWSGNFALQRWLTENGYANSHCIVSGSHQNSLDLLRSGEVDLIAVDAHYWSLLDTEHTVIVSRGHVAPTPPFITNLKSDDDRRLLATVLKDSIASHGHWLGISDILPSEKETYRELHGQSSKRNLLRV